MHWDRGRPNDDPLLLHHILCSQATLIHTYQPSLVVFLKTYFDSLLVRVGDNKWQKAQWKVHFDKGLGCQATNVSTQASAIFFELNFYKQSGVMGRSSCSCLQAVPSDEPNINDTPGLLLITRNSTDATFLCPQRITLMLAGNRVIEFLRLADTFVTLLAPTYYLDSSYLQNSANTFWPKVAKDGSGGSSHVRPNKTLQCNHMYCGQYSKNRQPVFNKPSILFNVTHIAFSP